MSMEQIVLKWDGFVLSLRGTSETLDRRRAKVYGRSVSLAGFVESDLSTLHGTIEQLDYTIQQVFKPLRVEADCGHAPGRAYIHVAFPLVRADKPSKILSEEEVWVGFWTYPRAVRKVRTAIVKSHEAWCLKKALEDRAEQATAVRNWVSKYLLRLAREKVRFSEKLEALRVELAQEVGEAFRAEQERMETEFLAHSSWREEGGRFHPRAVAVGMAKGLEAAVGTARTGDAGFGAMSTQRNILPEDVKEEK